MRSRQDIVDIFSTYIVFASDRFDGWQPAPRLRANMEHQLTKVADADASKHYFSTYWYQCWQNQADRIAFMHLGAYLQESAYWAAYKITQRFSLQQLSQEFSLPDCFQMAFAVLEKGLSSFQPNRGMRLESFARLFFSSTITNELRRAKALDVSSDWLMLRKLSRKQFQESLSEASGLNPDDIEKRQLAWIYFQQCYARYREAGNHSLKAPTMETWVEVVKLYNQERLGQLAVPGEPIDTETVKVWLLACVKWARAYLYPSVKSLNAPNPGSDLREPQDLLSNGEDSLLDKLLIEESVDERARQQQALTTVLTTAVQKLKASDQALLRHYYCENKSQKDIAHQLKTKQSTVCRQLSRARGKLLDAVTVWRKELLLTDAGAGSITVEMTSEEMATVSAALKFWLQERFCDD